MKKEKSMKICRRLLLLVLSAVSFLSCNSNIQKEELAVQRGVENSDQFLFPSIERSSNKDTSYQPIILLTWNIQDLGKSKDSVEVMFIASVINESDIAAIQEVVAKDPGGAQTVAKIADELNRMGSKWDYSISDPTNSPSPYKSERYAFLWRTSEVDFTRKARLDKTLEDKCDREPYVGHFKTKKSGVPFKVVNFHSRKHNDNPEKEIIYLKDYPEKLNSENVFIAGDFNLDESHEVWDAFYSKGYRPVVRNKKTTLKTKCKKGEYLNYAIDNIYYPFNSVRILNSNSFDYVKRCSNLNASRKISDHLPVYMEFTFIQ